MCVLFFAAVNPDSSPTADGQALAESLKSNKRLKGLWLENNHIGDRGAEAPAAGACWSWGI